MCYLARRRRWCEAAPAPVVGAESAGRHGELLADRHLVPGRRPRATALAGVADVEPREQRAHYLPRRSRSRLPLPSSASPRHRQQGNLRRPDGAKIKRSRIPNSSDRLSASGPAREPGALVPGFCCCRGHGEFWNWTGNQSIKQGEVASRFSFFWDCQKERSGMLQLS